MNIQMAKEIVKNHVELVVYSVDFDSKGERVLVAGCGEDPDFPEIWLLHIESKELVKLNDGSSLIDSPLARVFWAENQHDIVLVDRDGTYLWYQKINADGTTFGDVINDYKPAEYDSEKLRIVQCYP